MFSILNGGGITAKTLQKEGHLLFLIPLNQSFRVESIDLRENENPVVGKDYRRLAEF